MNSILPPVDIDSTTSDTWETSPEPDPKKLTPKESAFVELIRHGVINYRFQSLPHFALHINVNPSEDPHSSGEILARNFMMRIRFQNYVQKVCITCRLRYRKNKGTKEVQAWEGESWMSLQESLGRHFPATKANITENSMRDWWASNGSTFNWSGLPTETKENILQYCLCQPHGYGDFYYSRQGYRRSHSRAPGPREVVEQFGEWAGLLQVSAEVRRLSLQILFRGTWIWSTGLIINSYTHGQLLNSILRLSGYYQIFNTNSIPNSNDQTAVAHARQYLQFPRIYRELDNYATFMHGIRKIYLQFSFRDTLHFFKVSVGGFNRYRPAGFMTCDVFERLPHLNSICLALPTERMHKASYEPDPQLFHETDPCPRTLHRCIYERAAEELAWCKEVVLQFCMDIDEHERFNELHAAAKSALKFTDEELEELWKECDGGVPVDPASDPITGTKFEATKEIPEDKMADSQIEHFFPPKCRCPKNCRQAFPYAGRYHAR
ncbi:hypothetical protein K504DRAFT_534073 [Pleomassaria siparia CBS 279.74]|uniref:Uncharacterized protein n=1 Tax=Pleomassaria siparia CBS 279.74 TaxID=1314801 RepID=A0A6G1KBA9_9PLEO|nr:hypothetical protein K504DRAFT_534073 [Pleomassaria siparia CBS 279.74]